MTQPWSTPEIADQHPEKVAVLAPILRTFGGQEAFAGPVVTLSCFEDNSLVKQLAGEPGQGRVIVVDGGGSVRKALLGDQIAAGLVEQGWAGLIINGAVRDVEILRTLPLGVQALAAIPIRTEKRGLGDQDVPVTFGGVTFRPGQHLYADANGVLISERPLIGD